jgi:hypothetical protein
MGEIRKKHKFEYWCNYTRDGDAVNRQDVDSRGRFRSVVEVNTVESGRCLRVSWAFVLVEVRGEVDSPHWGKEGRDRKRENRNRK